jgi:carbon-monoxide dehydrogenase medium subunit
MKAPSFDYVRPASLDEALTLCAEGGDDAKFLAGGQSLGPLLNLRLARPSLLIDVRRLPELAGWRDEGDTLCIGAGLTHAAIEDGALPGAVGRFLAAVAHGIAYRAVRNRGTVGGSLAHADPAADWVSTFALLDAQLEVRSARGVRIVAADALVDGPLSTALRADELIMAIRVAKGSSDARRSYRKFNRKPGEFAEAIGGFCADPASGVCRAVIGATGGPPVVIADANALLDSDDACVAAVDAAGFEPGSFEQQVHAVMLRRAAHALRESVA